MSSKRPLSRHVSLRRAAATLFALVTLLPLLLFFYLHERFATVTLREFQISLVLVGGLALVGFYTFLKLMGQIAEMARSLTDLKPSTGTVKRPTAEVPGLGRIAEIGEMRAAFTGMLDDLRSSTERLEDLVAKSSTLHELAELAARVSDLQALLPLVLDRTMRTVKATAGAIMIFEAERQTLRVVAERGRPQGSPDGSEVKLGHGMAGRVAQTGETLLIEDTATDPRFAHARHKDRPHGSFLCLPVRVDDRVVGVINLAKTTAPGEAAPGFGQADLQFLGTLMTHVAYALDNARLFQESRHSAERLQEVVDELRATQARLVEGERLRAMGQLASGMAHHLNNLMMVISGRVETLIARAEQPSVRRSLNLVHRAALDAAEVVGRVRRFASVTPVTHAERVDLNQMVREVVELTRGRWRDEAEAQGVSIATVLDLGAIPAIEGEPGPLREALMNLILNAVDAMPTGGAITVRTWSSEGWVRCAVADTGVGMSEEVRRRAVEPFFTTKGPRGMGLGMSLIIGVVQGHRGELEIDSAPDKGTVVTVRLPALSETATEPPAARAITGGAPLRVLLVDDDYEPRSALADLLASEGHQVVEAENGRAALDRLAGGADVDLVLTDLGMPEMNGWELARAVRSRWADLPVGLVTGWGENAGGTTDERRGVTFVLSKPCTTETLRAAFSGVRSAHAAKS